MAKKRCAHCRQYKDRDTMITRGLSAYCDEEHFYAHQTDLSKPKTKASRKASRTDGLAPEVRQAVLEADGHRCRFCGEASQNLAVHHIVYRSDVREDWIHQPHNLISLCNYPCHIGVVHGDKKKYQPLCRQVVWLRMLHNDKHTTIRGLIEDDARRRLHRQDDREGST